MQRPSYIVVTTVTCVFVATAMLVKGLKPYLQFSVSGRLAGASEEFLVQGNTEPINWFPYSEEPFVRVRGTGKPILLLIGAPWSLVGRKVDKDAFQDELVTNLLSDNFECIRVDGMYHPDWLNALMPMQRLTTRFMTGFQIWTVDPKGQAISLIGQDRSDQTFDRYAMLKLLEKAQKQYSVIANDAGYGPMPAIQPIDLALIKNTRTFGPPDFNGFRSALQRQTDSTYGGFPSEGIQSLYPCAWEFQLEAGDVAGLLRSMMPILQSPLDDAVDGGFYRVSTSLDCRNVEFDKLTTRNAEMMTLLAKLGSLQNSPEITALSHKTWEYLTKDAYRDGDFESCRVGDEQADGRSDHSSYSPSTLRGILSSDDRAWARTHLGLTVGTNYLMCPFPTDLADLASSDGTFNRIVGSLKAADMPAEKTAGYAQLSVDGYVVARMLESARIWRDASDRDFALRRVAALVRFEQNFSQLYSTPFDLSSHPLLPDYLAYCDAELEAYLSSGKSGNIESGLAKLKRALDYFATEDSGVYRLGLPTQSLRAVQDVDVPEIADNTCESCSARIIRLALEYGRLFADTHDGRLLLRQAFDTVKRFTGVTSRQFKVSADGEAAPIASAYSPAAGGYYAESLLAQDDRYAIAVGPNAQQLSDELFARAPTRLVAPATGPIRRDLQKRAPGIYLLTADSIGGPYTVDQAAARLPAVYSFTPVPLDTSTQSVP